MWTEFSMLSKRITDTWIVNEFNFNLSFITFFTNIVNISTLPEIASPNTREGAV
jgi:hypothetical protein